MSEYQYYEFRAVDRPLTSAEMDELRALSTRALITPTRFRNVYNWGDFRGNPLDLMERYYDAFVYVANWGTNWLMLRVPRRLLPLETARRYCFSDCADVRVRGENLILELRSDDEEGGGWIEDEQAESWMPALLPLREELLAGDLRGLYIAWLACAGAGELDDEDVEPPVPAGLGDLSTPLKELAAFLRVDGDLLSVAAEQSPQHPSELPSSEVAAWLRSLPEPEKDDWLVHLVSGDAPHLRAELLRRAREAIAPQGSQPAHTRTVGQLLTSAQERAEARRRAEEAERAREKARRERERAAARAVYLGRLAGREEEIWRQVEPLIDTKQPGKYDQAVQMLVDLRDLAESQGTTEAFQARLDALRVRHARKPSLMARLKRVGLAVG